MSCMTKCDICGLVDFCDIHDGLFMCDACFDDEFLESRADDFDEDDQ